VKSERKRGGFFFRLGAVQLWLNIDLKKCNILLVSADQATGVSKDVLILRFRRRLMYDIWGKRCWMMDGV
jgi:hypothetical protein